MAKQFSRKKFKKAISEFMNGLKNNETKGRIITSNPKIIKLLKEHNNGENS